MQQPRALYQPEMRSLLADFASFDAPMVVAEYLRTALLFVYANTASHYKDLLVERRLALRLLSRSVQVGNRFAILFTSELRGKASSPVRSNHVHRLSRRIQDHARDEAAALERILRKETPDIQLQGSAFDPVCFAHCLETSLHEAIELSATERDIIFRSWAGLFAETVRGSYIKYIQVLLNGSELAPQAQQDFVDTIPFSIERRDLPARKATATRRQPSQAARFSPA